MLRYVVNVDTFVFPRNLIAYIDAHSVHKHVNEIHGRCVCEGGGCAAETLYVCVMHAEQRLVAVANSR